MKAGVVHAQNDIRYEDIDYPKLADGKIIVKVKYTGICGSDVPRVNGTACHFYPNVLGHEFSGTVCEIGSGVSRFEKGDRVAGIPLIPCFRCPDCQRGDYSLCKNYSFIGSREFGSFAEYVLLPETNAVRFDDAVSFEEGAFFEPATVALHGLNRLDYTGGGNVAVIGGGTVGMFTAQWAKIYGAKNVYVLDIVPERLQLAGRLGCIGVDSSDKNLDEKVLQFTGGRGFDYVYETAGNSVTVKLCYQLVANKGRVCFIGTPNRDVNFTVKEWENINRKEFVATGSWMSYSAPFPGSEWELVAHFFKTGDLKIDDSFIFRKVPLSQIASAFEMFRTPGVVKGKILVDSEG